MKDQLNCRLRLIIKKMGWEFLLLCFACILLSACVTAPATKTGLTPATVPEKYKRVRARVIPQEIEKKYPYIEFQQDFPETYLFQEDYNEVWDRILTLSDERREVVLFKDKKKGEILIQSSRQSSENHNINKNYLGERIFFEQRISVKPEGSKKTYITNYVSLFESDQDQKSRKLVSNSNSENLVKGIFYGTLANAFYGKNATQSKPKGDETESAEIEEVVHTVKSGETLGGIALEYTGKVMNYKAIADYNEISDPKSLRAGQKIRIPKNLIKDK